MTVTMTYVFPFLTHMEVVVRDGVEGVVQKCPLSDTTQQCETCFCPDSCQACRSTTYVCIFNAHTTLIRDSLLH